MGELSAAQLNVLESLEKLDKQSEAVRRHGDFETFLGERDAAGKLPTYLVKVRRKR
jgi:hypothetical protein